MFNKIFDNYANANKEIFWLHLALGAIVGAMTLHIATIIYIIKSKGERQDPLVENNGLADNGLSIISNRIIGLSLQRHVSNMHIPEEFICPYTKKLMLNPVVNVNGISIDREPYIKYLEQHQNTDPVSQERLADTDLFLNINLRTQIIELLEEYAKRLEFHENTTHSYIPSFSDVLDTIRPAATNILYSFRGIAGRLTSNFGPPLTEQQRNNDLEAQQNGMIRYTNE